MGPKNKHREDRHVSGLGKGHGAAEAPVTVKHKRVRSVVVVLAVDAVSVSEISERHVSGLGKGHGAEV